MSTAMHYHWNIVGPQFNDLHEFFEAQYTELNDIVDASPSEGERWAAARSGRWRNSPLSRDSPSSRASTPRHPA